MIRETRLFCKLSELKKTAQELYREEQSKLVGESGACPCCGCRGKCAGHGWYERSLIDHKEGETVYARIRVKRERCESCGHTHAILPDYIVPYSSYSLFFILRVLAEHFLKRRTVEGICGRYGITASMLYQWKKLFAIHKDIWLGVLETAETTSAAFIRRLIILPDYAGMFGEPFFKIAARSFLQGHQDVAQFRHAVF